MLQYQYVSTDLHLQFDVWVTLAALSVSFIGKSLFLNFPKIEIRYSLLKQNWFAASIKFKLPKQEFRRS